MVKQNLKLSKQIKPIRHHGTLSMTEYNLLKKKYELGKSAFGSVKNLSEATNLPQYKVDQFLQTQAAATKYRQFRKKYPRLKVIVNDINEIWSVDVAYMDKLSIYNRNYKYLLVAVDCMSRYLRVEPMQNKFAADALKAFKNMIKKKKPKKCGWMTERSLKVSSKIFVKKITFISTKLLVRKRLLLLREIYDL